MAEKYQVGELVTFTVSGKRLTGRLLHRHPRKRDEWVVNVNCRGYIVCEADMTRGEANETANAQTSH